MRFNRLLLMAGAVVAVLMFALVGGAGSATAARQPGPGGAEAVAPDQRVRIVGRVEAITDQGIRLATPRGVVRVRVNEQTEIMVQEGDECVEGTLQDLEVGRPAMVAGVTTSEPRVIMARGIRQCRPPEEEQRVRIIGRVEAVTDQGIRLATRRGEVRVQVSDQTEIMVEGDKGSCVQGTLQDLEVGQPAMVVGRTTGEPGVIAARGIRQCAPEGRP